MRNLGRIGFVIGFVCAMQSAAAATATHPSTPAHPPKPTQSTSYVFCKTTATPQYFSAIFQSSTWNHATDFQNFVAKKYNRGNQAAICYPRATREQAQKYKDQLISSAKSHVPEDAPKREVVVETSWSPPAPTTAARPAAPASSAVQSQPTAPAPAHSAAPSQASAPAHSSPPAPPATPQ